MIVKIVYDELVNILGSKNEGLTFKAVPPVSILLVGLQGSGKTTSAAKLAKLIEKNHKKRYGSKFRRLQTCRSRTIKIISRKK